MCVCVFVYVCVCVRERERDRENVFTLADWSCGRTPIVVDGLLVDNLAAADILLVGNS